MVSIPFYRTAEQAVGGFAAKNEVNAFLAALGGVP